MYAEAAPGGDCYDFAKEYGITTTQLYQWNPIRGQDGIDCSTEFKANTYY